MRKFLLGVVCLLAAAPAASAQGERKSEFFVGYLNLGAEVVLDRADRLPNRDFFDLCSLSGFEAAGAGYFGDSGLGLADSSSPDGQSGAHSRDRDEARDRGRLRADGGDRRIGERTGRRALPGNPRGGSGPGRGVKL